MKPEEIMTSNGWQKDPTSFDYWQHPTLGTLIRSAGHWKWHKPGVRRPQSMGDTLKGAMSILGLYQGETDDTRTTAKDGSSEEAARTRTDREAKEGYRRCAQEEI